jgi:hypothetical protein
VARCPGGQDKIRWKYLPEVDFHKLLPGASNLQGCFIDIGDSFMKDWGSGLRVQFGPSFGKKECDLQLGNNRRTVLVAEFFAGLRRPQ